AGRDHGGPRDDQPPLQGQELGHQDHGPLKGSAMAETPIIVTHTRLHDFIVDVLTAMRMGRTPAETTAGHMVQTDLRGVDSHGIGMLPRYIDWWREGYLRPDSEPRVVRDDGAMALFDAGQGLGHYVATLAMRTAIAKARAYGIGVATVRNSSHFGAATDPGIALRHRLLSPLGGSRELGGHKGYGLGVMVDILSGVLNGAVYGNLFERSDMKERKVQNAGHYLAAIDPSRFRPIEEFKR